MSHRINFKSSVSQKVTFNFITALPICTSSARTGNTILIDTSMVPPNDAITCTCSVDIDANAQSVHVGYEPVTGTTSQCGLLFHTGIKKFECTEVPFDHIVGGFNQLEFSKTSVDADACFILFIGKHIYLVVQYTGAFTYQYTPAIFINKLTTFLVFEQSSLARNRPLDEFVYIIC